VVVTGAVRDEDRIVAVASRPLFRAGRELGAYYRSALAHELVDLGYTIEGGKGKEERYFVIAGVPQELCGAFPGRTREVVRVCEGFRAKYGRAPEPDELLRLKLENRRAKELTTRDDLDQSWRETADRYAFGPGEAAQLLAGECEPAKRDATLAERVERSLTESRAVFELKDFRAAVLEQSVGELSPEEAPYGEQASTSQPKTPRGARLPQRPTTTRPRARPNGRIVRSFKQGTAMPCDW
jgi:hypothetical protein